MEKITSLLPAAPFVVTPDPMCVVAGLGGLVLYSYTGSTAGWMPFGIPRST